MNKLTLQADEESVDCLFIHPDQAVRLGLEPFTSMTLRYGIRTLPIRVVVVPTIRRDVIRLSRRIIQKLQTPLSSPYQLKMVDNEILIGPYISFLVAHRSKQVAPYLRNLTDYLRFYPEFGGTVLAFSLEGVDRTSQTIRGYRYDPQKNTWVKGRYPYPASIFVRGDIQNNRWCRYFTSVIGDKVFNNFYLDKWAMHRLLSSFPQIRSLLPATALYRSPTDIYSFLRRYSQVYIKPIHGTMGISILKVVKTTRGMYVHFRQAGKNKTIPLTSEKAAKAFFQNRLEKGKYVIQQALQLLSYRNKPMDFRMVVVKNETGEWRNMGIIARYGAKNSIISNISAQGRAEDGVTAIQKVLQLKNQETERIKADLEQIALRVVRSIEASGVHFANTGIDLGIDRTRKIWLIEVQHSSPAHSIAVDAGNLSMYRQILRHNMSYLTSLAGFS